MIYGAIYVLAIALLVIGSLNMVEFGVEGIKSQRGLWWWNLVPAGLYGAYVAYDVTTKLRPAWVYPAVVLAIGLGGAVIFPIVKARWPTLSEPSGFPIRFLIYACAIEYFATGLAGGVLTGLVLVAFSLVFFHINRLDSKNPRERRA